MKSKVTIIVSLLLSCSVMLQGQTSEQAPKQETLHKSFRDSKEQIEKRRKELAAVPDTLYNFVFTGDDVMKTADPHAYWLLNRMMQTVQEIRTAEDAYAWALMMRDCVRKYNNRMGKKIGSVNLAIKSMRELVDRDSYIIREEDRQQDEKLYKLFYEYINSGYDFEETILSQYDMVNRYVQLIEKINVFDSWTDKTKKIRNEERQELCYREFSEWFNLLQAQNDIRGNYSFAIAGYSSAPREANALFKKWVDGRLSSLEVEEQILLQGDYPYNYPNIDYVSDNEFDELITYFKTRNKQTVLKEIAGDDTEGDFYDNMSERVNEYFDFKKMAKYVSAYETALENWQKVREDIALSLPAGSNNRMNYRLTTEVLLREFYNDLAELKELHW